MLTACGAGDNAATAEGAATRHTVREQQSVAEFLDLADSNSFAAAARGLVAEADPAKVSYPNLDRPERRLEDWAFLEGDAPPTVNPSLWRQAKLNNKAGLYKVVDGIHQLRGFDLANMTLIDGEHGWIVIDPLTSEETARQALEFARSKLGDKPVTAVVYTHSHVDHFGGVLGVLTADEARSAEIPIVAPKGFLDASTNENLLAGPAMLRRATYVYAQPLEASPTGHVGIGLGKVVAFGDTGILAPTHEVSSTGEVMKLDGVTFEFQLALGSEAPAEFTFYLPDFKTFCGAEIVSQNMHNLYTLRGAKVRDALAWSRYIDEAIERFPQADVYFGSHQWPVWGRDEVVAFLESQRDMYKYIHDQTVRLANAGLTPAEIAEEIELPPAIAKTFSSRGYYGSVKQNVKGVYLFYFGWYDGNPANLNPLPPVDAAKRYVELAGGAAPLMERARQSYEEGDYRWTAELLGHLVFAEPNHREAKQLLAESYRQLGYQAESSQWRNSYLVAAYELEHGVASGPSLIERASESLLLNTPVASFFDALAVGLSGPKAVDVDSTLNVLFTDLGQSFVLKIKNGVLHHYERAPSPDATATLKLSHKMFIRMLTGKAGLTEILFSDDVSLEGSKLGAASFFRLFKRADANFPIVTP